MKKKEETQIAEPKVLKKRGRKKKNLAFNNYNENNINNEEQKEGSRIEDEQFRELKKIKHEEKNQNLEDSNSDDEKILEAVEL